MRGTRQTAKGPRGLLIAGPTASGKSALALRLARALDARGRRALVVNCDSMQVYADLRLVTARPSPEDEAAVPHALYGHVDGSTAHSVAAWRDEVRAVLAAHGDAVAVFTGGTGLYFRVLTQGIAPVPAVPAAIREEVRRQCARQGPQALHGRLDPIMARRLAPGDSQRVCRALEVLLATGRSLADWQAAPPDGGLVAFDPGAAVVLDPPRPWLEARMAQRAEAMLGEAGLAEVAALKARGLPGDLPVMRALGVAQAGAVLDATLDRRAALEALVVATRRYGKRQATWFRGQMGDWPRLDPQATDPAALDRWIDGQMEAMAA